MSVGVMSWVWKHSEARGTQLLVLLAIADHCQDDGHGAYPGIESLAAKCRMSPRAVQDNIYRLQESGELGVEVRASQFGTNRYVINMSDADSALANYGDADSREPVTQIRDDNLRLNHKESSVQPSGTKTNTRAVEEEFNPFWKTYPPDAKGKRPEKQLAIKQWIKLSPQDRERALVGAKHYAAAHPDGAYVKYAHRWLRDRTFESWQTPARASPNGAPDRFRGIDAKWERTE